MGYEDQLKGISLESAAFSDLDEYYLKQMGNPIFLADVRYGKISGEIAAFIECRLQRPITVDQIRDCLDFMINSIADKRKAELFIVENKKEVSKDIEENVFSALEFVKDADGKFVKRFNTQKKR